MTHMFADKKFGDFDLIFLSFDEPAADWNYEEILKRWPNAKRVHGVKGIDAAHKACARLAETDYFFTLDADCVFTDSYKDIVQHDLTVPHLDQDCVFSWSCLNPLNGLIYGNGSFKMWPKKAALEMKTHENSLDVIDFHQVIPYYQMNELVTVTLINDSPEQAFRAGYREGYRLAGAGQYGNLDAVPDGNRRRILAWSFLGSDKKNGRYSMLGARVGAIEAFKAHDDTDRKIMSDIVVNDHHQIDLVYQKWCSDLHRFSEYKSYFKMLLQDYTLIPLRDINTKGQTLARAMVHNPNREGMM